MSKRGKLYNLLLIFVVFSIILFVQTTASSESNLLSINNGEKYGLSFDNVNNNDGTRTLIFYSGIRNVYENGWKRIENAKSLKNIFNVEYLEYDPDFSAYLDDFNYSSVKICLSGKELNKDIPFKMFIKTENESNNILQQNFSFADANEKCFTFNVESTILDKYFKWGFNSTLIKINSTGYDKTVRPPAGAWSAVRDGTTSEGGDIGTAGFLRGWDGIYLFRHFFYFNTTEIPDAAIIESVKFAVYLFGVDAGYYDADYYIGANASGGIIGPYPSMPYTDTDWNIKNYLTFGGMGSIDAQTAGWYFIDFNATGLQFINTTGMTNLVHLSTDDGSNVEFSASTHGGRIYLGDSISYKPYLNITYTENYPPTITPSITPNISYHNSTLNYSAKFTDLDVEDYLTVYATCFGSNSSEDNPEINDTDLGCMSINPNVNWSTGISCEINNYFNISFWSFGNITCKFYANDNVNSKVSESAVSMMSNLAPDKPDVSITPSPTAGVDEDLSCSFTPFDMDRAQSLTAYVEWLRNNVTNLTFNKIVYNNVADSFILESENTSEGDFWSCKVRIYDGIDYSSWSLSSQTEIVALKGNFSVKFVSPTPANEATLNKDYFTVSIQIGEEYANESLEILDDTEAKFNLGSYNFTFFNTSFIQLSFSNKTGSYESNIFDANGSAIWNNISWSSYLPANGELSPDYSSVLLMHMNEDYWNGTTNEVIDSSIGNHGTAKNGANTTIGKFNRAGSFDGVNDYINITHSNSLNINNQITIEAWIKPNAVFTEQKYFVWKTNSYGLSVGDVNGGNLNKPAFYLYKDGSWNSVLSPNIIDINWHHIVGSYNSSNMLIYVDGVLKNSTAFTGNFSTSVHDLGLGNYIYTPMPTKYYFNGVIDEAAIYNRSLNSSEILDHYTAAVSEIKFQARSCDDGSCSGESFLGPDGSFNSFYSENSNLNLSSNKYFQYKSYFSTSDGSPRLYNVSVGYTKQTEVPFNISSAWVLLDGNKYYMSGSGLSWSYSFSGLSKGSHSYVAYANDSYNNVNNSETRIVYLEPFNIVFNATDSYTHGQLAIVNELDISCNNSFSVNDVSNPAGPYEFFEGKYECTFSVPTGRYDKTIIFTADTDKTVEVPMSYKNVLTNEEHTWLEAIYNCLYNADCDLLRNINETTTDIWNQLKRTDQSVIINENITSYEVSATSNLSIDYSVDIPIKKGYSLGDFLPIRIGYWFLDEDNESCYSQGEKPEGVESPYCYPLIAETLGPMGGNINFTVDLRPSLPTGTYTIIRDIEIDPNDQWIKYGQQVIGQVKVLRENEEGSINLFKIESAEKEIKIIERKLKEKSGMDEITGAVVSTDTTLNKGFLMGVFATLLTIIFILNLLYFILKGNNGSRLLLLLVFFLFFYLAM